MSNITKLALTLVVFLGMTPLAQAQSPREVSYEELVRISHADPRTDVELGAALCRNESGDSEDDCASILHMRMRSARYHGRSLRLELLALHGDGRTWARDRAALRSDRATNPREGDSNAYIGDLRQDLHRPMGWPEAAIPWDRYKHRISQQFDFVERILAGDVPDPCRGRAVRWGGRQVDAHHIARHLERGEVVLMCGNTRNAFLGSR